MTARCAQRATLLCISVGGYVSGRARGWVVGRVDPFKHGWVGTGSPAYSASVRTGRKANDESFRVWRRARGAIAMM